MLISKADFANSLLTSGKLYKLLISGVWVEGLSLHCQGGLVWNSVLALYLGLFNLDSVLVCIYVWGLVLGE